MIKNLLLIDDDETTLVLLKKTIIRHQFAENIILLKSAGEAVTYFDRLVSGDEKVVPDLIFLDIFMPSMNGWYFMDKYSQKFEPLFPNTRICILTSSQEAEDQEKAAKYPCIVNFWNKPLFSEDLEMLKQHETLIHHFQEA